MVGISETLTLHSYGILVGVNEVLTLKVLGWRELTEVGIQFGVVLGQQIAADKLRT